jgi:C-5 cytosine-specific DNA methylase
MTGRPFPLAIDLFTGLHGWAEGLVAEGWEVVGFDLEDMCKQFGEPRPAHVHLVIQDVLTIHGSQFKDAALIVASPPCQEYSYMAMPWSRAKAIRAEYLSGVRDRAKLTALFDACFRIQREACEAAGRHIPLIVENVRGAQEWVGRSRWAYGSFHLWGDVPALMPMTKAVQKFNPDGTAHPPGSWFAIADSKNRGANSDGQKVPGLRFDGSGKSFQTASVDGMKTVGHANIRDGHSHTRHLTNQAESDGIKQAGISGTRDNGKGDAWFQDGAAKSGSKSKARKAASAKIAKIPFPLSSYIAKTFLPSETGAGRG